MPKKKKNPDMWMPFYMGDFKASTSHLSHEEKWAYIEILWAYWKCRHRGEFLKNDKKTLKIIAGISSKKLEKILGHFECRDGNIYHARVEQEVSQAVDKHAKKKNQTKAARQAKLAKTEPVTDPVTASDTSPDTKDTITFTLNTTYLKDHIDRECGYVDNYSANQDSQSGTEGLFNVDNFLTTSDKQAICGIAPTYDIDFLIRKFNQFVINNTIPTHPVLAFLTWTESFVIQTSKQAC